MSEPIFRPPTGAIPAVKVEFAGWQLSEDPAVVASHKTRRLVLIVAGVVIIGVICGVLGARPAYLKFKGWRSQAMAAESLRLTEAGKLKEAFAAAQAAYMLAGDQPLTLRAVATVLAKGGETKAALRFWVKLCALDTATAGDHRAMIDGALSLGDVASAQSLLEELSSKPGGASAITAQLQARLALANQRKDDAILAARRAVELDSADSDGQMLLGGLLLSSPETRREGEDRLRRVGEQHSLAGLKALMLLAIDPASAEVHSEWLAAALQSHPEATALHQLKAFELKLNQQPSDRAILLQEAQGQFGDVTSTAFVPFCRLLITQGESDRVLQALPEEVAFRNNDWLILRLDALALQSRWSEILRALKRDDVPLEPALVHLFRARCHTEMGNFEQAKPLWALASKAAGDRPELAAYFSGYAAEFKVSR